jgi:NDP-sugar pyrophosphorylase family protein
LGGGSKFGVDIKYSFEKVLLDTGGGLKKVERYFKDETFIMYNSDVITNVDLREMVSFHKKNRNYVTLLASDKHDPKHLRVNKQGRVLSIEPRVVSGGHTFCGIHIIEPDIFKYIPKNMPISIIPIYRKLIEQGFSICVFPVKNAFWQEIGSRDSYEEINAK